MRVQESVRRAQESSGGPRRPQGSGELQSVHEAPGGLRRVQGSSGGHMRAQQAQDAPGGPSTGTAEIPRGN